MKFKKYIVLGLAFFGIASITSCKPVENGDNTNDNQKVTYTVIFDSKGGSTVTNATVEANGKVTKPADPTKEGYTFKGWLLNGVSYDFNKEVTENIILVASWEENTTLTPVEVTYTVTFDSNGGSSVTAVTVKENGKVTKPADPTKEGCTFKGWLLDNAAYDFNKEVTGNITLVASWEENTTPVEVTYTVTFNSNGGSNVTAATVKENGKVSKPADPTKEGYTFAGWLLDNAAYDFNTEVTGDITLVASWTQVPQIALTQTFTFENVPTVDGTDSKGNAKKYVQKNYVDKYLTLFATEAKKMELSAAEGEYTNAAGTTAKTTKAINTGGGADDETRCVLIDLTNYSGKKAKIQIFASNTGKTNAARTAQLREDSLTGTAIFEGSYEGTTPIKKEANVNGGKKYYFNTDDSIRIYAINVIELSEDDVEKYTISFETSIGTVPQALTNKTTVVVSELPTFNVTNLKKFDGWTLNGKLITEDFDLEGNITLVAKWSDVDASELATVTYQTNLDGVTVSPSTVLKNTTVTLPTPTKDGYRFAGWYTDGEFKNEFVSTTLITDDTILYGKFIAQYTVSFKEADGTLIKTVNVDANGFVSETDVPSAKFIYGKKFVKWTNNNVEFKVTSTAITTSIELVAAYEDTDASAIQFMIVQGAQESLYSEFVALEGVTDYNAYVLNTTDNKWVKLDKELIRLYKGETYNYYRVDAVGLKAGSYKISVAPVVSGEEQSDSGAQSDTLAVTSYDRSGFAFSTASPLAGKTVGAYNLDGTLKSNARVLYVTENSKNKVSLDVIVNNKGKVETFVGVGAISQAMSKGFDSRPLVLRIIGKVTQSGLTNENDSLNLGFKEAYKGLTIDQIAAAGITIEGIGNDTTLHGTGVRLLKISNAEIRNLGLMYWPDDGIALESGNKNIWVHNCDIFYGKPGSDADQVKGDGSMDLKDDSQFITISYLHFWDSGKMSLCGMKSESGPNYITYRHNWFDHSDSRHPRIRTMSVHVYNNYFDGNSKYGVGVTTGADAFVEGNYFRNCKNPMMSSLTGTDALAPKGTFSKESAGTIKAYNNHIEGASSLVYANAGVGTQGATMAANSSSYDAILAANRNDVIPSTYNAGGATYNNFDTTIDLGVTASQIQSPDDAKATVMKYAGRLQGGDFKWTFNNEIEDTNDSVIADLKTAITNYASKLISVLGIEGATSTPEGSSGSSE